jgi:hypothetical protein
MRVISKKMLLLLLSTIQTDVIFGGHSVLHTGINVLTGIKLPHQFLQYCHLRVVLHRVAPSTVHPFTALCLPQPPP